MSDQEENHARTGRLVSLVIIIVIIVGIVAFFVWRQSSRGYKTIKQEGHVQLISSAFKAGGSIPKVYTCQGDNINPPLTISDIAQKTKSLALILHDPDAPSGDFTHWIMWNIPPSTTGIKQNSVPAHAMQGQNDFNKIGYGGPCPPSGTHHYVFELYALDSGLDLNEQSHRSDLITAMQGHIVGQTSLTTTFSK